MKLPYIVTRMWDMSFVVGVGLLLVTLSIAESRESLLVAAITFNAGVCLCSWLDRFHFDRLASMGGELAKMCDAQAALIKQLHAKIDEMKRAVDGIVGEK